MIAVIFELLPHPDRKERYFELAASLKEELAGMDGFLSIERFESLSEEGKYLSLSFWRDEEAVRQWRQREHHRQAQKEGRAGIFQNYRLRVAHVLRDYGLDDRGETPDDSRSVHGG
ncbi:antibiotic biosynthesis monooxygenase family protein [Sneathiella chinensis]|uniref:Antibiotic biosynthesis monooxygenase n=1 Tax=Sneathiella chinensis TaxID=349750 RepID=A0ABQ5U017_9PROT|nr:antibiotic biosynthesis monooxygenase [Sneathiella chinensis]GLQ05467.1 antibiotic biosynthesis monooxygenase [Sneathiella chinensis]